MKEIALPADLYEYVVQRFAGPERELLQRMRVRADRMGLPAIHISEEQAKLVRLLARLAKATRALDVGTLFGYSAAVLAEAMGPRGRVVSLELDPVNADVAEANLRDLGLHRRVEVRRGVALAGMRSLRTGSFDLVLIDADKENYSNYLEEGVRLLRPQGLLLVDNAFAFGRILERAKGADRRDADVRAVQAFNEALARHRDLESVLVPVGDGLAVAIRSSARRRATTR